MWEGRVSDEHMGHICCDTHDFLRKEFINLLALAIYLTTSSPLRGEDLVTITYKNTRDNIRNILIIICY